MRYGVQEKKNFSYAKNMIVKVNPKHPVFRKYGTNIRFATILAANKKSIKLEIISINTEVSLENCIIYGKKEREVMVVNPYYLTQGDVDEVFNYYISEYYPDNVPEGTQEELSSLEGEPFFVPVHSFEPKTEPQIPLI